MPYRKMKGDLPAKCPRLRHAAVDFLREYTGTVQVKTVQLHILTLYRLHACKNMSPSLTYKNTQLS